MSSQSTSLAIPANAVVVIYDGMCVLCRQSVRIIKALDWLQRVHYLDLHDWQYIHETYPKLDYDELMGALHIIYDEDNALAGFVGLRFLARSLPLTWLVLPFLHLPGMNWLGPKVYAWVARHRYRINQLFGADVCDGGTCKIHPPKM